MANPGTDDHGLIRSDFPGGWQGDTRNGFTNVGLAENQIKTKKFLQKLLKWREQKSVIHNGKMTHFVPEDSIYVFFRYTDQEKIMVVMSLNKTDKVLNLRRFSELLPPSFRAFDVVSEKSFELSDSLFVPANKSLILEIKY
jgi:glycosidase